MPLQYERNSNSASCNNVIIFKSSEPGHILQTKSKQKPRAAKVFQGKYSDIEIHFRLQNSIKMDLIAVIRFLGIESTSSFSRPQACIIFL